MFRYEDEVFGDSEPELDEGEFPRWHVYTVEFGT